MNESQRSTGEAEAFCIFEELPLDGLNVPYVSDIILKSKVQYKEFICYGNNANKMVTW